MMRFVSYFLFIICGLFVAQVHAQTEMKLTLDECVEVALSNNLTIEQGKYTVALSEASVDQARNRFLPNSSNLSWGISRSVRGPSERQVIDETTGGLINLAGNESINGGQSIGVGGLTIPIYDGQIIASLAASKKRLEQQRVTQIGNRYDVIFFVKQDYFQLLQTMKLLEVQQERVGVSEESLRRAETLYEIGSAAILQVAEAKALLANTKATLIQRENDVLIARSNLGFTMGLGTDVDVIPSEEDFALEQPPYTYDEALKIALDEHPDILSTKYGMLAAKDDYRATKYSLFHPTIRLGMGSYNWSIGKDEKFGGIEDFFLKNYSYTMSLNVSMPIFNFNTTNNLKQQKLTYLRSQVQLDQAKRQKALNVKLRYLNLERFRRQMEAQEIAVEAQEENFKLQEEKYNFGGGTFLERLTAQRDLFDARNNLVQVKYNYLIQMAQLENELGTSSVENEK
ncbi:MAG: outer membrane protein [Candidatus Latescibacterota bacterium]|jgi:outer membrane protein